MSSLGKSSLGKSSEPTSPAWPVSVGCPVFNCPAWRGRVYPKRAARDQWLHWYSRHFNTVEGNSTFYGLPAVETTRRWAREAAPGFRFCFKFPRLISHELELSAESDQPLREFLTVLQPLVEADLLGPTFLQLGPAFGPDRSDALERFLRRLPAGYCWAVELRHHGWFDQADNERWLDQLLTDLQIDKVIFDSRALFQAPPDDDIEKASQSRKPQTPVRDTVTGRHPIIRIVGRNQVDMVDQFFDSWVTKIVGWIEQGLRPYVFTHAPDDAYAPELATRLLKRLQVEMPALDLALPTTQAPRQLSLLD